MKLTQLQKNTFANIITVVMLAVFAFSTLPAEAYGRKAKSAESNADSVQSVTVPAKGSLEVAFSPDEGAEQLVIKTIESAQKEILMLSYSFTSAPVVSALDKAVHRGVTLRLVADYKGNVSEDRSGKARAALSALANAGADVRVIKAYKIHHDKVIIVDRNTVEIGSFNYSAAAAHQNSENVLVNWNNPDLAAAYVKHFERNYGQSEVFTLQY